MKTKLFSRLALAFTFLFMAFAENTSAQVGCPYTIDNSTSCQVVVRFTVYRPNCTVCYQSMDIVIPASGSYVIPCGAFTCGNVCPNLEVLLINIGNTTVWTTVDNASSPAPIPNNPCTGTTGTLVWSPSKVKIIP